MSRQFDSYCRGYTEELADEICLEIASNSCGLNRLCEMNPLWPKKTTIYKWLSTHESFAKKYRLAKVAQIAVLMDEVVDISDDSQADFIDVEGISRVDAQHIARSKLRVDSRKWLASKLMPSVYGSNPEELANEQENEKELKIDTNDPLEAAKIYQEIMLGS